MKAYEFLRRSTTNKNWRLDRRTKIVGVYACVLLMTLLTTHLLIIQVEDEIRPNVSARRKLTIVLSQPRSGSSWIGSFFDADPDIFYVYEPLHVQLYKNSKKHLSVHKSQEEIMTSLCLCRFTDELIAYGILDRSSKISSAKRILGSLPSTGEIGLQCKRSKHTVAKVLQLNNFEMLPFLSQHCDVQIVHLIRDPRDSIKSRMETFGKFLAEEPEVTHYTQEVVTDSSKKICGEILTRIKLLKNCPVTIKWFPLLYEDVLKNPVEKAKELFAELQIKWSEHVEQRVIISSTGSSSKNGGFETVKNTAKLGERWKVEGNEEFITSVELGCSELLHTFGYN